MPTKEQIETIIKKLQQIMRIQDWDISIEYISQYEMKHVFESYGLDTVMMCERNRLRKEAIIYINIDHLSLETDWYESIVHELYHIVVGGLSDISDDLMDEINVSETLKRSKIQLNEQLMVQLAKIFTNVYPVTNFDYILKADESLS